MFSAINLTERQLRLILAFLIFGTLLMVLFDAIGAGARLPALVAAVLFFGLSVGTVCWAWVRQIMAETKTGGLDDDSGRTVTEELFTFGGYNWRVVLGLVFHLAAVWWIGPIDEQDPLLFMGVGIGGLYILLGFMTRAQDPGYSRRF